MKKQKSKANEDKGTKNVIQQKKGKSFVRPKGDASSFTPPTSSGKQHKSLPDTLQSNMESSFGHDFSNVAIHTNSQKAVQMNARAFTQGEEVHFAPGEFNPSSSEGQNLIGHEFTHVAQQRAGVVKPTKMLKKGVAINDNKGLENEADNFGRKAARGEVVSKYRSSGLGIRSSLRTAQAKSTVIQRNIKSSKTLANGKMELDFTKVEATAKGGNASEDGWVKFHPNATAPESNAIKLLQIVRVLDVSGVSTAAGKPWNYAGSTEGNRDKIRTKNDSVKNVSGGFFIDHFAASANQRTKKADAAVSPFYNTYGHGATGKRKGATKVSATLWDGPGHSAPAKFSFVTSAKAEDTGTWYGTALWGFEIYLDKGIAKIKGEYSSFREVQGATTDAALKKFNDFYKNPGTTGAPTK